MLPNSEIVFKLAFRNATGRTLESRTIIPRRRGGGPHGGGGSVLEDVVFSYDALGHRTTMTRYQDANNQAGPVTTTWHTDSLGWVTKQDKTGVATQTRTFDSAGNVTLVQWCDDLTSAPCPTKDRRTIARYDSLNRLIHREDQDNTSGGQAVSGTAVDLTYDANSSAIEGVPRNNMLGRLASATWATGQEWRTYDAFGRVNSRTFLDTTVTPNPPHHYEIHEFHDDGSEKTLHLAIQDTNKDDEQVNCGYDSAGRIKSVVYSFRGSPRKPCSRTPAKPIYDVFGRLINAKYGDTRFNAAIASNGRRLLRNVKVTSRDGLHSREIHFPTVTGLTPHYDPMGRELTRLETRQDGTASTQFSTAWSYDPLGRLASNQQQIGSHSWGFSYDGLGNMLTQFDPGAALGTPPIHSFTYQDDRICGIGYDFASPPTAACNVSYDGAGNVISQPTSLLSVPGSSGTRTLDFFPNGAVKRMADGASNAEFRLRCLWRLAAAHGPHPECRSAGRSIFRQIHQAAQRRLAIRLQPPGPGAGGSRHAAWGNDGQLDLRLRGGPRHALCHRSDRRFCAGCQLSAIRRGGTQDRRHAGYDQLRKRAVERRRSAGRVRRRQPRRARSTIP